MFFPPRSIWYVTQDVALGVSSCMIRCIAGALCMLYARSLELLGVAGTMLSNETAPLLLQKSETDESPSSAVLKHAFIGEIWACRYERRCCSASDLEKRCFIAEGDCCLWCDCGGHPGGESTAWTSELRLSPTLEDGISPGPGGPAQPRGFVEASKWPLCSWRAL